MRRSKRLIIERVKECLDKPLWYNQTITKPWFPNMLKQWQEMEKNLLKPQEPKLLEIQYEQSRMYADYYSAQILSSKPKYIITGVTSA